MDNLDISLAIYLKHSYKFQIISLEVGSFEEAKEAINVGVDAIIVQGREAGGHVIGQV